MLLNKKYNWSGDAEFNQVNWSNREPIAPQYGLPQFMRVFIGYRHNNRTWAFEVLYSGGPSMLNQYWAECAGANAANS